MANCYVTAEPCTLEEFLEAARAEGFEINDHHGLSISHEDGRCCYEISEEEHEHTHVGMMRNPHLPGIKCVSEGTEEYEAINQ